MDIEKIKEEKKQLEYQILLLIAKFQELTGIVIDDLSINNKIVELGDGSRTSVSQKVNIKITL